MPLYLDYSATTPVHPEVLEEMIAVYTKNYGNAGSRTHVYGQNAAALVEKARQQIASVVGIGKQDVVFTSGATESDNLAILGLAKWGLEHGRKHLISTRIEHKAVLEPLRYLEQSGFEVDYVSPGTDGRVRSEDVLSLVRSDTLLVSVMHVNNETGVIQPVAEIGAELLKTDTFFHVDAAQSFGKLIPEMRTMNWDLMSISGHKIYGPQGIGALLIKRRGYMRPPLRPIMFGGGQEAGLRPGTLPVALIVGLGKAAELCLKHHEQWRESWISTRKSVLSQLDGLDYAVNGDPEYSLPSLLNVSFAGIDSEALMLALRDDYAVSNGSACTSSSYEPSHVLKAMGLDPERIDGAIRLSWGVDMEPPNLDQLRSFILRLKA